MYRLIIKPCQKQDNFIQLTSQQQHYLRDVIRLGEGDRFLSLNGQGKTWLTQFKNNLGYLLEEIPENRELSLPITLIIALPKGNGFEEIIRCCTELGVHTLIPVISERTLLNPSANKVQRWRKIALEATEQCERQFVPKIVDPISLKTFFNHFNSSSAQAYFCVTRHLVDPFLTHLQKPLTQEIILATGPEGGWTEDEIKIAVELGFTKTSLGKRILRAITAPIVAMSLISATLEKD